MELKSYFAQDTEGNVLPGATCRVYLAGTTTLAEGIRDANNEPKANPFNAGSNGLIQFAAPNGIYDLSVSSGGSNYTLRAQCNDVSETLSAVEDAKDQALQAAQDSQNSSSAANDAAIRAEEAAGIVAGYADKTHLLTKGLFGRFSTSNLGTDFTTQVIMELESDFLGVRIGIPNAAGVAVSGVRVCVAVANQATAPAWLIDNSPVGEWHDATFNGATSATLPTRIEADRPSITWSDLIHIESVPRTDGKVRPLLMVRIEIPSGGVRSQPQNGIAGWRNASTERYFKAATQNVLGVTNKASYTNTTNTEVNVSVPYVQYASRTAGRQLLIGGDSTVEGVSGSPNCYGAAQRVAYEASTPEFPVEYFNAAVHSAQPSKYHLRILDLIGIVLPTNLVYSPYSVNDVAAGTGLDANAEIRMKVFLGEVLQAARRSGCRPDITLLEGLPHTTAYRPVGVGDSQRLAFNAWLATVTSTTLANDYAAAVSGPDDGTGQIQLAAAFTNDGVHPNAAGYAALADALRPYIPLGTGE